MLALQPYLRRTFSDCTVAPMTKKKKPTPFRAAKAVKSIARDTIGSPPPTRVVPEKTKQTKEKHRPTLSELLSED